MSANEKPEFKTSRMFDAPKHLVFEAWTKAEYVSRWFAPAPLTTADCVIEPRAGGVFRLVMRMPNGIEHPMDAKFVEVVTNERIVFAGNILPDLTMHTTVTFTAVGDQTRLDVHQVYSREAEQTRGAPAGWKATLDQLEAYVRGRM